MFTASARRCESRHTSARVQVDPQNMFNVSGVLGVQGDADSSRLTCHVAALHAGHRSSMEMLPLNNQRTRVSGSGGRGGRYACDFKLEGLRSGSCMAYVYFSQISSRFRHNGSVVSGP